MLLFNFMKPAYKSVLLTIPFLVLFFVIRNLPVEPCDFLHEETYNAEGQIDYCGSDDNGFVDLSIRKWPMNAEFKAIDSLKINQPCKFEINIEQADGSPLTSKDVALSHTQKIHLLAVNESLDDYQHIHPVADGLFDGVWHFEITPKLAGRYSLFLDFIPAKSPRRVLISSSFNVSGEEDFTRVKKESLVYSFGDINFQLEKQISQTKEGQIDLTLLAKSKSGDTVGFYPVMGAFAHLVAFDQNAVGFAHLHPLEDLRPVKLSEAYTGSLTFGFSAPKPGIYRLWAQVKTSLDEETFIPFDIRV